MENDLQEMNDLKRSSPSRGSGRVSTLSQGRRTELATFLNDALQSMTEPKVKHARLNKAIRQAMLAGVLHPGDQLPPEQEIGDSVSFSLGTVRRCLSKMAQEGVVSREHGRGTFVAGLALTENEVWHFRYLKEDLKTVRPIYQRVISRQVITEDGPWSQALGENPDGFIRIERAVNVDSLFVCYSDFYLRADRFQEVMEMTTHEIESVGVKHIMAMRFHVPIVRMQKILQTLTVPPNVASVIQVTAGKPAHRLLVIGYDIHDHAVSYQVIWMPDSKIPLDLSATTPRLDR
jgi:DNA-binding GntR family transcriptional regulator|tara:strand:+ start:194 stop:1063 length:870 start_codon:yes stop_codon:yes gene_type:complete